MTTRGIGISIHTGWAACVVVGGTRAKPEVLGNVVVHALEENAERFCYHVAVEMKRGEVEPWLAKMRRKAIGNAKRALAPLLALKPGACAIVAKPGDPGDLDAILAAHPRLHTAEGAFFRDVFAEACRPLPVHIVPPKTLDISGIGKLAGPPWGKDQKLATAAVWSLRR